MSTLVTVITPCYNSAATLEATIQSVLAQRYAQIEYVIMDGGSNDETAEIAAKYAGRLTFVSERDRGQSDAINKGWQRAKGDVLAWLNADDHYLPDTVENAVRALDAHPDVMWVYGTAESIDEYGSPFPFRNYRDDWDYPTLLYGGNFVNQPSVFVRRQVFEEFGLIDETLHYAMDYEYWLRIGRKYPGYFVPSVRVRVIRASTTKSESGGVPRMRELERIVQRYGARDLPLGWRHEWEQVFIESAFENLRHGHWRGAAGDFRRAGRYPAALPHGLVKVVIRSFVPRRLETRLRQAFVHV